MRKLSEYRVQKCLQRGLQTAVYKAFDITKQVPAVLKLFEKPAAQRGREEASIIRYLNTKDVLPRFLGEIDCEFPFGFAYEYIPGIDGHRAFCPQRLPTYLPRRIGVALAAAVHIADDLVCLHDANVVHRDVKPDNAVLTTTGYFHLIDFELATHAGSKPHTFQGTLGYAAPEQIQATPAGVSPQTDQWSLGTTLYVMLTGKELFRVPRHEHLQFIQIRGDEAPTTNDYDTMMKQAKNIATKVRRDLEELQMARTCEYDVKTLCLEIPGPWHVREGTTRLLHRCLQQQSSERYPNTIELLEDLQTLLGMFEKEHGQVEHRPNTRPYCEEYYRFLRQERNKQLRQHKVSDLSSD